MERARLLSMPNAVAGGGILAASLLLLGMPAFAERDDPSGAQSAKPIPCVSPRLQQELRERVRTAFNYDVGDVFTSQMTRGQVTARYDYWLQGIDTTYADLISTLQTEQRATGRDLRACFKERDDVDRDTQREAQQQVAQAYAGAFTELERVYAARLQELNRARDTNMRTARRDPNPPPGAGEDGHSGEDDIEACECGPVPEVKVRDVTLVDIHTALLRSRNGAPTEWGKWGPKTAAAVKAFQRSKQLPESGIVDPTTWRELQRFL